VRKQQRQDESRREMPRDFEGAPFKEEERAGGRVDMINACYMQGWKCHPLMCRINTQTFNNQSQNLCGYVCVSVTVCSFSYWYFISDYKYLFSV
jgi:hypothetical protein